MEVEPAAAANHKRSTWSTAIRFTIWEQCRAAAAAQNMASPPNPAVLQGSGMRPMSVRGPPHQSRRENSPRRGPGSEALTTAAPHHPGRGTRVGLNFSDDGWLRRAGRSAGPKSIGRGRLRLWWFLGLVFILFLASALGLAQSWVYRGFFYIRKDFGISVGA